MKNNIGLLLAKRAELSPNSEAYVDGLSGQRLTFTQLNERSNKVANGLVDLGVNVGDRVALLMMNCNEFIETFFALAKIGAVVVPLNWRLVPDELAFILKDSGSTVLIYGGEFAKNVDVLHEGGSKQTDIQQWVHVGGEETRAEYSIDLDAWQGECSGAEPEIRAEEDDLLYIMYTSGTTGLPKGAMHTHNSAIWASLTIALTTDQRYKDRYLQALPLYHVGALTPMTGCVHQGITSVVMRAFDPVKAWELIESEGITTMLAVPAMLNFMLQVPNVEQYDYSQLRWIMSGAAPVPVTLIHEYHKIGIEVHQVYGLTETCGPACLTSPEDAITKAGSTGKAYFHTDVRVVNEKGADVAPGEPGEVIIRAKHLMLGYWNLPEATAETIKNGWLYSGDVATMDEDGFIYIQDRTKDMIISGGENVYPAEIENVILSHPDVKEVAVIGQASKKWGETPLAIVVKNENGLGAEEILGHCKEKLAPFKMPRAVEFVDEIPRNPTGKVLKRLLREKFSAPAPE